MRRFTWLSRNFGLIGLRRRSRQKGVSNQYPSTTYFNKFKASFRQFASYRVDGHCSGPGSTPMIDAGGRAAQLSVCTVVVGRGVRKLRATSAHKAQVVPLVKTAHQYSGPRHHNTVYSDPSNLWPQLYYGRPFFNSTTQSPSSSFTSCGMTFINSLSLFPLYNHLAPPPSRFRLGTRLKHLKSNKLRRLCFVCVTLYGFYSQ